MNLTAEERTKGAMLEIERLLSPEDPPSVGILNQHSDSPYIFICDHGNNAIPIALAKLGLDDENLRKHIAYDLGALQVATLLAKRFNAPLIWQNYSRLVVDCNRQLDHPQLIPLLSDHIMIPGNKGFLEKDYRRRVSAIFLPYHDQIRQIIEARCDRNLETTLISIHSFTPIMDNYERPWHIGVLSAEDKRLANPIIAYLKNKTDYTIGENQPYEIDSKDYTIPEHAIKRSLLNVLIEIRQDLIDTIESQELWSKIISDALSTAKKLVL